jgi:hypothetical protein
MPKTLSPTLFPGKPKPLERRSKGGVNGTGVDAIGGDACAKAGGDANSSFRK